MSDISFLDGGPQLPTADVQTLMKQTAEEHPDQLAIISTYQKPIDLPGLEADLSQTRLSWTYKQLSRCAESLADRMTSLGLVRGTPILLVSGNCAEWALFCWTSIMLECPFVTLDPASVANPEEIQHMLRVVCPGVVAVENEGLAAGLEKNAPREMAQAFLKVSFGPLSERYILEEKHPLNYQGTDQVPLRSHPIGWLHLPDLWPTRQESVPFPKHHPATPRLDIVTIGFTSGTTSLPKACPLSKSNLQIVCALVAGGGGYPVGTRILQQSPAHHSTGSIFNITVLASGGTIVYPSSKFDVLASLDTIEKEKCNYTSTVPAVIKAFSMVPDISHRDLSSLWHIQLSGATVSVDTLKICRDVLQIPSIGISWGMTENVAPLGVRLTDGMAFNDDDVIPVGRPAPGMKVKVCMPGTRTPLKRGEEGELHAGGPQVISGYLNAESDNLYDDEDGHWIVTGDMASIDAEGQVRILGRQKDIIIRGGVNISPASIERRLNSIPGVESQVVGLPDEMAGELPVAIISFRGQGAADPKGTMAKVQNVAIRELGQKVAPALYLDLKEDLQMEAFPTTSVGKVKKPVLQRKVRELVSERTKLGLNDNATLIESTEDSLSGVWSFVSGLPREKFHPQLDVFTFVDSITAMRFCGTVRTRLGKDISVADINENPTIRRQALFLDSRAAAKTAATPDKRNGPPRTQDMAHCNGSDSVAAKTRELAEEQLNKLGLNWEDHVEDVIPAPDTSSIYLSARRPQTWNRRQAMIAHDISKDEFLNAWKAALAYHPLMRTIIVEVEGKQLFVVLRVSDAWWECSIKHGLLVDTKDDLRSTFMEWADPTIGPLFKLAVVSIKSEPQNTAIINVLNHAIFDNISIMYFYEDLMAAVKGKLSPLEPPGRTPFRVFADEYRRYRTSPDAQPAVDYHVSRLNGISSLKSALWPPQRAPGLFKGIDYGWKTDDGKPGDPSLRQPLDEASVRCGIHGVTHSAKAPGLEAIRPKFGIKPLIVLKAAVALFNVYRTGCSTALFANFEAARSWPLAVDGAKSKPNPLSITGPTFETVVNRIDIDPDEKVIGFLKRVQDDQSELSAQSHAPFLQVLRQLTPEDAQMTKDIMMRQIWNWPESSQQVGAAVRNKESSAITGLERLDFGAFDDVGLAWTCGLWDLRTFYLICSYDDCQLRKEEAIVASREVLSAAAWLVANLEARIAEADFNGQESKLIPNL